MADEAYWTYKPSCKTLSYEELPENVFNGNAQQWYALSPGMRREIVRQHERMLLTRLKS